MKITEITPLPKIPSRKLRVCAYVRVSTGHKEQLYLLENQTQYYTRLLSSRPDMIFYGIYSDEDISGGREDRPGFQKMMKDAR